VGPEAHSLPSGVSHLLYPRLPRTHCLPLEWCPSNEQSEDGQSRCTIRMDNHRGWAIEMYHQDGQSHLWSTRILANLLASMPPLSLADGLPTSLVGDTSCVMCAAVVEYSEAEPCMSESKEALRSIGLSVCSLAAGLHHAGPASMSQMRR
jgi:hypothetical protein